MSLRRNAQSCILLLISAVAGAQTTPPETDRWALEASDYSIVPGARLALRAGFPARLREALTAADSGDVNAMTLVGIAHHQGVGAPKDPAMASVWSRRAAEAGNARAMNTLGVLYTVGFGVVQNEIEAVRWLRAAMNKGNALAQLNMAYRYRSGNGVPKSETASVDLTRRSADQGYAQAQFELGQKHAYGYEGLQKNADSALFWFQQAAQQDHPAAIYQIGIAYYYGRGVLGDYSSAAQWFYRAREAGYSDGAVALSIMYEQGRGVTPDSARGRALLREAANANNTTAHNTLSRRSLLGEAGEKKDPQQALAWAQRAIAGRSASGHYWEAYALYHLGKKQEAFASMRRAEESGVKNASAALAEWQKIADNETRRRQEAQQRQQVAAATAEEKKGKGGGLLRGVIGAGVGALAAASHGADAEQTLGAMAMGAAAMNPGSQGAAALGAAGQSLVAGQGGAPATAGAAGSRASYPTKPNLAQGSTCPGFTIANYQTRAFEGGNDTQLFTMCGQAFEYYKMYLNAIRKGYSEADANKTYAAHAAAARNAQSFLKNSR